MYGASRGSGAIRVLCALGSWWLVVGSALGVPDPPELNAAEGLPGRGEKKFGDGCKDDLECGFDGAYCDPKKRNCICRPEFDVTNHIDKCGYFSTINESCFFNEQCPEHGRETVCRDNRCQCRFDKTPMLQPNGNIECIVEAPPPEVNYVDPAMIGVLVGMALMFIIICVVLRLFSKARWRENRTIFNTPNPRLMNVSLLRDSKLLHGQERRGSRASVRGPSRQPSMASLRPHSPSASQGSRTGSRRGSRGSSGNASATSTRSNKSSAPANNVAADSVLENVTVEILDSKK